MHALRRGLRAFSFGCALALTSVVVGSFAIGCGAQFDPPASVKTLRVFGAKVDKPYAKPGETVTYELFYYDASPKRIGPDGKPRNVQVYWYGGCNNPIGDLYYGCFPVFGELFASAVRPDGSFDPAKLFASGNIQVPETAPGGRQELFRQTLPADLITSRPPPSGTTIPYGLNYAFFSVCAGETFPDPNSQSGLPIGCRDPQTKAPLGADDFVFGYASAYAYDTVENKNPVIDGRTFQDKPLDQTECTDTTVCAEGFRCGFDSPRTCIPVIPHCTAEKLADCPTYKFGPVMDAAKNSEFDANALDADGKTLQEVMWVYYYASDGTIGKDTRLINDAQAGWQDPAKFGTEWQAPGDASGPTRIWGVFHDNRGGAEWTWWDVYVD